MLTRLTLAFALLIALPVQAFETQATHAWVYDVTTGTVLMDKSADVAVPPASMSKLMTVNLLFEALRDGRVTPETTFAVSTRAKSMQGSTMFLNEQDRPSVEELIHGMIVNSGNDACVAVAEGLAGTEDAFVQQMTDRAAALGMRNSHFANASGWPDPQQRMSMEDLGILAVRLITEFPDHYKVFAQTEYDYKNRAPQNRFNRNPLLKLGIGADGLKTGHTEEAGYGLVGSAVQGDRRIVLAITGLASDKDRAEEAERIVNWAFRQFSMKTIAQGGTRVATAAVWLGEESTVGLVAQKDVERLIPAMAQETMTAEVVYSGPIAAPIEQGAQIAELVVHIPGLPDARIPLLAETAVAKGGFLQHIGTAAKVLYARMVADKVAS